MGASDNRAWFWAGDALVEVDGTTGQCTQVLDTDPLLLPTLSYKGFASITAFLIIVHLARWGILKHIMRYKDPDKAAGGQKQATKTQRARPADLLSAQATMPSASNMPRVG